MAEWLPWKWARFYVRFMVIQNTYFYYMHYSQAMQVLPPPSLINQLFLSFLSLYVLVRRAGHTANLWLAWISRPICLHDLWQKLERVDLSYITRLGYCNLSTICIPIILPPWNDPQCWWRWISTSSKHFQYSMNSLKLFFLLMSCTRGLKKISVHRI